MSDIFWSITWVLTCINAICFSKLDREARILKLSKITVEQIPQLFRNYFTVNKMKLRIQTLTGETHEVEAEPQNSILDVKKIIYKQMKITGAVRVIKGQEILPDGSSLEEHGIIDGSTVNIVIEPEKEIILHLMFGPKEVTCSRSNSLLARDLKQQLIDGGSVGFKNFSLIIFSGDNAGISDDIPLADESLPLHLYGVVDNTTIRIIGGNIQIQLVIQRGQQWYKSFPRNITVNQMKQRIRRFLGDDKDLDDIWLFVERNEAYRRLDDDDDDEASIGSVLTDNDVIYVVEDRFFSLDDTLPVYYKGKDIGSVGWTIMSKCVGDGFYNYHSDTLLSLKLRIQELLGFPVSCVSVKVSGPIVGKNDMINLQRKTKPEITIKVA